MSLSLASNHDDIRWFSVREPGENVDDGRATLVFKRNRRLGGYIRYPDTVLFGGFQVDVVHGFAEAGDQLQFRQSVENRSRNGSRGGDAGEAAGSLRDDALFGGTLPGSKTNACDTEQAPFQ